MQLYFLLHFNYRVLDKKQKVGTHINVLHSISHNTLFKN